MSKLITPTKSSTDKGRQGQGKENSFSSLYSSPITVVLPPDNEEDGGKNHNKRIETYSCYTLRDHCKHLGLQYTTMMVGINHGHRRRRMKSTSTSSSAAVAVAAAAAAKPKSRMMWYCDWSDFFIPNNFNSKSVRLTTIVQDYCQPIDPWLERDWVGLSYIPSSTTLSIKRQQEQEQHLRFPPVRTMSILVRPDVKQKTILQSVQDAFTSLHPKCDIYCSEASSTEKNTFYACGLDGGVIPIVLLAQVGTGRIPMVDDNDTSSTSTSTSSPTVNTDRHASQHHLERRLWLRFYHMIENESSFPNDEAPSKPKIAPLRNAVTPLNTKLAEACVLIQYIADIDASPSDPSPSSSTAETRRFLQNYATHELGSSPSVLTSSSKSSPSRGFPSLSNRDYDVLQESHAVIERIWSELEMNKCTWNTLAVESSSRFGSIGQPTLDRTYCLQLSQVSQHHMLMELHQKISEAEQILHSSLEEYIQVEEYLVGQVMRKRYHIPIPERFLRNEEAGSTADEGDIPLNAHGQTPVSLPKHDDAKFPWHDEVRNALNQVADRTAYTCFQEFDPLMSLQLAEDAVQSVYTSMTLADDVDLQAFLKRRNRQAMIKLTQQQERLRVLMQYHILPAPDIFDGGALPRLKACMDHWIPLVPPHIAKSYPILPLLVLDTKMGGSICVTPHLLIVKHSSKFFSYVGRSSSSLLLNNSWLWKHKGDKSLSDTSSSDDMHHNKDTNVQVFCLVRSSKVIDVVETPPSSQASLVYQICVMENGKPLLGFNLLNSKQVQPLLQLIRILQTIME